MNLSNYLTIQTASTPVPVTDSMRQRNWNGYSYASASGISYWKCEVTTVPMVEADFMPLSMAINQQGGVFGVFDVKLPWSLEPQADATVSAQALAGSNAVSINSHALVKLGTFIKFSGHKKIYQVTASTTTGLEFYPALIEPVLNGEAVIIENPTWSMGLSTNDYQGIEIKKGMQAMPYTLQLVECF